jgi:xanthine dehydrogenase/oxidase
MLTEQMMVDPDGRLFSDGTFTYKPPCTKTIPLDFRVALYPSERRSTADGSPLDQSAVQSSKGVGEPALVLATSVLFAVKHAILAARQDEGVTEWFEMEAPATPARIQSSCLVSRRSLKLS